MNTLPVQLGCLALALATVAMPANHDVPKLPDAVKFASSGGGQHAWLTKDDCYIGANIQKTQDGYSVYLSLESNTKDTKSGYPELAIVAGADGRSYLQVANKDGVDSVSLNDAVRVLKKLIAAEKAANGGDQ